MKHKTVERHGSVPIPTRSLRAVRANCRCGLRYLKADYIDLGDGYEVEVQQRKKEIQSLKEAPGHAESMLTAEWSDVAEKKWKCLKTVFVCLHAQHM